MNINHTIMFVLNKLSNYTCSKYHFEDDDEEKTKAEINTMLVGMNIYRAYNVLDISYYESYAYYTYKLEKDAPHSECSVNVYYILKNSLGICIEEIYENGRITSYNISSSIVKIKPKLPVFDLY